MRRPIPVLILSLMLTAALIAAGCTTGKGPPAGDGTPQAPPAGTDASPGSTPGNAPGSSPGRAPGTATGTTPGTAAPTIPPVKDLTELVTAVPAGTVEHVTLDSAKPIDRTGVFFLNTATKAIDGWMIKDGQTQSPAYGISPDNRWIVASRQQNQQQVTYLADRKTGKAYRWEAQKGRLLAGGGSHLLFEAGDRFWLTGENPTQGRALTVTPAQRPSGYGYMQAMAPIPAGWSPTYFASMAIFAPDGRTLFLFNGPDVYLIGAEGGEAKKLMALPAKQDGQPLQDLRLEPLRPGGGLVLAADYRVEQPNGPVSTRVLRFAWDGKVLSDVTLPHRGGLSPDGRFVWWQESLGDFAPAVVLADAAGTGPILRLDGATYATGWLPDNSGLVVRTQLGYQVLTTAGNVLTVPAFAGTHGLNEPVVSPDQADRFAIGGTKVLTAGGAIVASATPYSGGDMRLSPWGYTGDELRFGLHNGGGKGYSEPPYILPPRLEHPPFDPAPAIMVNVPKGDCLNLRTGAATAFASVTCLPHGTRLHRAEGPGRVNKGWLESWPNPVRGDMGEESWLYVRTDAGQRGYVRLSRDYLDWAPAQPGTPAPDALLERIADERFNMASWITAALGETNCPAACSDPSFDTIIAALYNRDKTGGGLAAALRNDSRYSAARHEAALKPLEQAGALIVKAWSDLGQPGLEPSAAWKQAVRDARSLLLKP